MAKTREDARGSCIKRFVISVILVLILLASCVPLTISQNNEFIPVGNASISTSEQSIESETLWLDAHGGRYPSVYSSNPLMNGTTYLITIEGTWSPWSASNWTDEDDPPIGLFEEAPMYPSSGGTGRVGLDPFWGFACVFGWDYASENMGWTSLPAKSAFRISMDNGSSWSTSVRPSIDLYSPVHRYNVTVVGEGEKIGFRIIDAQANDNYGTLKIVIENDHDTDGDGLLDSWEKKGIDFDHDGNIDLNLSALGADWEHKDIFVEADYMNGKRPNPEAIEDVEAVFSSARVSNPDNIEGINLHVLIDEGVPWKEFVSFADYYDLKNKYLGTQEERLNNNSIQAKMMVYRYCLFANKLSINGVDARCPGVAEGIVCDDFILAFGAFSDGIGSRDDQAAVFMHELGHALGLGHGGDTSNNYKPNYLSIMNYAFQYNILVPTRPMDYSYGNCIALDESNLDEYKGIGQDQATVWLGPNNTIYRDPNGMTIDWDYSGWIDNRSVKMNVNNRSDCLSPTGQLLEDFNDWANLVYKFRGTPLSAASAFFDDYHIELTTDQIEQMRQDAANIIVVDSPIADGSSTNLPIEAALAIVAIAAIGISAVFVVMRRRKNR